MIKDQNCAYCMQGDLVNKFGYFICNLETSVLYLFREQSNKGRCIIAHNKHVSELIDLTDDERDAYFKDIALVSRALHQAFQPGKVNYGAYGDTGCHLHFHLVPKYEGGNEWGSTFEMNKQAVLLTEAEYAQLAEIIKQAIDAQTK